MKFLCIDLGDKRTGLAICDSDEILASPLMVLQGQKNLQDEIIKIAQNHQADGLVFGLALNMDGSEGERVVKTRDFAEKIKGKTDLPVFFQDERLSSYSASQKLSRIGLTHKKKKDKIDAIAAAEILKEFIAARK
ncbi:MAG: Holliday junction resolvase RuvX [Planctomycetes bacterium]|nr:Holliday junction resolvase RuvX [Planctomycetota bacterium]MBU1517937.1 Holliday junction resolvase RuvX [Planctomycetota bacterium]MBU2458192.1 Holliday junction resolvase RuvX [Planctomycetota bacterium]MBU2596412.1 Holliday junction resolvase RuvX [Planctomycetota bacterium]